jgi:hypothetical protein
LSQKILEQKGKKIKERKTSPLIFSSMQGAKVDNPNIKRISDKKGEPIELSPKCSTDKP